MSIAQVLADDKTQVYPFAASVAHARGNLLYWDTGAGVAKSAGVQADQLTEQANQRLFASLFCGVMQDVRLAAQTVAGEGVVVTDGVFDCECTSGTFEPGDLVAAVEAGSGTALENSKVKKTTDLASAIGYAVKRYASATTTVRCRLISKLNPASINRLLSASPSSPIGYATGAGGAVTQTGSITTAVELNTATGQITTVASTLAAGVDASFTLTNSTIEAGDVVVINTKSYGGTADGIPICKIQSVAAGSCVINIHNQGAVALDALIVMSFAVIKAKAA